jgi:hypothetical protein
LVVAGEWEEASRLWTELGCPYEAALALHDSGEETVLRQALKTFARLDAPAAVQLTRHKMRALGIRSIGRAAVSHQGRSGRADPPRT